MTTFHRFLACEVGLAVALCVLAVSPDAAAQTTLTLANQVPELADKDLPTGDDDPTTFNAVECGAQILTFGLNITGSVSGLDVEVWAGSGEDDCSLADSRRGELESGCWKVAQGLNSSNSTVDVAVQGVAAGFVSTERRPTVFDTTDAPLVCLNEKLDTDGNKFTLHFMLVDDAGDDVPEGQFATWPMVIDARAPDMPAIKDTRAGEGQVFVEWEDPGDEQDISGYLIFCSPPPGDGDVLDGGGRVLQQAMPDAGLEAGPAAGGAAGAAGASGIAGAGGTTGASGAAGTGVAGDAGAVMGGTGGAGGVGGSSTGAGGVGGAAGTAGAGGTSSDDAGTGETLVCDPDGLLQEGLPPPSDLEPCGHVSSNTSSDGKATGLVDGQRYAIAVATEDALGNRGPLELAGCVTPTPVDDFFERYRSAGGKGGGGFFCALGRRGSALGAALLLLALGAIVSRRRSGARRA